MKRGTHAGSNAPTGTFSISDGSQKWDIDAWEYFRYQPNFTFEYMNIINRLIIRLKSAQLWDKYYALWVSMPNGAGNYKVNLKNPSQFYLQQTGTVNSNALNGISSDGSTGYLDTGFGFNSNNPYNPDPYDMGLDVVLGTNNLQDTYPIGAGSAYTSYFISSRFAPNTTIYACSPDAAQDDIPGLASRKIISVNSTQQGDMNIYGNGVLVETANYPPAYTALWPGNIYILAANVDGVGAEGFCTNRVMSAGIRKGLTAAECFTLSGILTQWALEIGITL
jgi:hypothetical protein